MSLSNMVTGEIPAPEEVGKRLDPDTGEFVCLAHFVSEHAESKVLRYDYRDRDGSISSDFEVTGDWTDDGAGFADLQLNQENWDQLDDIIDVLAAARHYVQRFAAHTEDVR